MIRTLDVANQEALAEFDSIIDVRSPGEFAEDRVPAAINLPVLSNEDRALVGAIYVQQSRFDARRLGAAIVARNIAVHLEGALAAKPPRFAPLIYCWRGGQRSTAMATVFEQIGWRPTLLAGGYKTYRRAVRARLNQPLPPIVLLGGHTGTAKTAILSEAKLLGAQVLDLEAVAQHRGSLLGNYVGEIQPSQKMFESRLAVTIAALDLTKPVLIEAESSKIGNVNIPEALWKAMASAPMIELTAPIASRARYLVSAYDDLRADPDRLTLALGRLPSRHGRKAIELWKVLAEDRQHQALAIELMEAHYDPAYVRWGRSHPRFCIEIIALRDLSASSLRGAAVRILKLLDDLEI